MLATTPCNTQLSFRTPKDVWSVHKVITSCIREQRRYLGAPETPYECGAHTKVPRV
eukprot:gene3767-biopygen12216